MTFVEMRTKMLEHFAEMTKDSTELFEVSLDKDKLWDLYLESFPPEKNKIFRERREHDCSCCRHFIKTMGNVVAIKDGKVISLWDFDIEGDDTKELVKHEWVDVDLFCNDFIDCSSVHSEIRKKIEDIIKE